MLWSYQLAKSCLISLAFNFCAVCIIPSETVMQAFFEWPFFVVFLSLVNASWVKEAHIFLLGVLNLH